MPIRRPSTSGHTFETIKRRHDPTVTTVAGVHQWNSAQNARNIGLNFPAWLDHFYMSRMGIRFLIGKCSSSFSILPNPSASPQTLLTAHTKHTKTTWALSALKSYVVPVPTLPRIPHFLNLIAT
ncbi:hypothetical protein D9615_009917 [Tricholomella constricta]|uniref:Branched-chain alpha-ketoacid dehydrogenase kinase/Pyruvate dehydrogenase kinase N-terminal domain-containing protein n=1 Tax=Tricholomella constricta TaxID=117010 RepID=A0A8H5LXS4_9AGAR|nr:hypothetical protein D9615_009917 [Tricholomella constricta]